MADYFPCQIEIGGPVTEVQLEEIEKICAENGGSLGWGENNATVAEMLESIEDGDGITIMDDQARYGKMEDLEGYLQQEGIQYLLKADARYEHEARCTYFNGSDANSFDANQAGNIVVTQDIINDVVDILKNGKSEDALAILEPYAIDMKLDKIVITKPIFGNELNEDNSVSMKI